MSFSIDLMNNQEELNKISKSPTTVMTLTGTLREETDLVNPQINIEYSGTLTNTNYMYFWRGALRRIMKASNAVQIVKKLIEEN